MTTTTKHEKKVTASKALRREASRQLVPFEAMKVREKVSQREFKESWARKILAGFDPEKVGTIVVNKVGSTYWIIDGAHRAWAAKNWLSDWKGQKIECDVYEELSEAEEAEMFLSLNNIRMVGAFDRFRVAVTAKREAETNIQAICARLGLKIQASHQRKEGGVYCVGTLKRIYERNGMNGLHSVLAICHDAFGDAGLSREVLEGVALIHARYNGAVEDTEAKRVFGNLKLNTVMSKALRLRHDLETGLSTCVASVLVDAINSQRKKDKIPAWSSWRK